MPKQSISLRIAINLFLGLTLSAAAISSTWSKEPFVAGTQPDRRPQYAPVQTAPLPEQARNKEFFTGVTKPVPESLKALQRDQRGWYTPFSRPGMTSYYDIRGWHSKNPDAADTAGKYLRDTYSEWHTRDKMLSARNEDCLQCHQEIMIEKPRAQSPGGVKASDALAWYQSTLSVYEGKQETFHYRHLQSPLAKRLMNLQCNFCHLGHDPRDENLSSHANAVGLESKDFTLRKTVNPETTCLRCHGQFAAELMGLPGPWYEMAAAMGNNCMICHETIRTTRHNVTYLNKDAIEKEGRENADTCYGCHGGRAWYRISYPYPRNPWEGMPEEIPEWAKDRPTQSQVRFLPSAVSAQAKPTAASNQKAGGQKQ